MVQMHEIDMRTPEQLRQETIKEFVEKVNEAIKKVEAEYHMKLVLGLRYEQHGVLPAFFVKEEPKAEEKKE